MSTPEFNNYQEIINSDEIALADYLAELCLPKIAEPFITPSGYLGEVRELEWSEGNETCLLIKVLDSTNHYVLSTYHIIEIVDESKDSSFKETVGCILDLETGGFTVQRDFFIGDDSIDNLTDEQLSLWRSKAINSGRTKPMEKDWNYFMRLIERSEIHKKGNPRK